MLFILPNVYIATFFKDVPNSQFNWYFFLLKFSVIAERIVSN